MLRKLNFLSLTFLSLSAFAQNSTVVKLNEAVKMGLDASKSLKMSQSRVNSSEAKHNELVYSQIPNISVGGNVSKLSDIDPIKFGTISIPFPSHNYTGQVSVSEPIFAGFRAKYLLKSGEYLENAAKFDLEKERQEVVFNIINAYFNFYKLKVSKALLDENMKQIQQHLEDVNKFEKTGLATTNDVLKVQLQSSNIELSRIDAENNLKVLGYNFSTLLGKQDKQNFDIDTTGLFASSSLKALDFYMQEASSKRSDLKSLEMKSKSADAAVNIAKGKFYPLVSVGGNYIYANPNPRVFPPADKFTGTWDAGVNLKWDITSLVVNHYTVSQAKAGAEEVKIAYEALTEGAKSEINQSYYACLQAREKVRVAHTSVEQANENYRIMNVRYNEHVALLTDLLDANISLLQAKMNLAVAKADAEIAYHKLMKSSGILE